MKKTVLYLFFVLHSFSLYSQRVVVTGFVRDSINNEPLIGAKVWDEKTGRGVSSDHFGHYSLILDGVSDVNITASFIGYRTKTKAFTYSENLRTNFYLSPGIELDEIVVQARREIESRIEMGLITIPVSEMKNLPVLGEPDVLKAMQLMPGIQGGAEGRSGLYVRGGSADQNLMLLDGASVYYVNHFGNFLSLFHPEIISNVQLYKGAFPAKYGGRLSSVVDLRMREGNKKEHRGSFGIGLLSSDLLLEGPIKKDTTSYIFSVRRFYLDALIRPLSHFLTDGISFGYNFYDVYGKISHTINNDNRLYLSLYSGHDKYGIRLNPIDNKDFKGKTGVGWGNVLLTARLNSKISSRLLSDFSASYTRYAHNVFDEFDVDKSYYSNNNSSSVQDFSLKSEFNHALSPWYDLLYGGGTVYHNFQPGISERVHKENNLMVAESYFGNKKQNAMQFYAYFENIIRLTDFFKLNLGLRYTAYNVDNVTFSKFEPRFLAVLGNTNTGVLRFSYSENMQPLHLLSYQSVGTPTDLWMPATSKIKPATGNQLSIGYAKSLFANYELSVEAYRKKLYDLIDYKDGTEYLSADTEWFSKVETGGKGTAEGVELLFRKTSGNTTGWISYTLSKSERLFDNKNNGKPYPYTYDRRHDFSFVVNHKLNDKIRLSASWVFGTGYPFTLPLGHYQAFDYNWCEGKPLNEINPYELNSMILQYSDKNSIRMGNSHRLDLGFHIDGKTKKGRDKTWSFNIYNAYNRQNPAHYYYRMIDPRDNSKGRALYQQSGFPIIPSFTYRVKW